jgi:hypothetical protein
MTVYRALAPCPGRLVAWKPKGRGWINLPHPRAFETGGEMIVEMPEVEVLFAIYAPSLEEDRRRTTRLLVPAKEVPAEKDEDG